jgi:hypothetical protein
MKFVGKTISDIPVICLVAANAIPLYGVAFAGWDAFSIVLLYWAENLIIGFYNVLKISFVRAESPAGQLQKLFMIPFFILHYGGFCAVHGIFVLLLFGKKAEIMSAGGQHLPCVFVFLELLINVVRQMFAIVPRAFLFAFASLFISHGISFVHNFILKGEYLHTTGQQLMSNPYSRIVVMHIAILGGAFLSAAIGTPVAVLIVLVILKTIIDLKLHSREHKKFGQHRDIYKQVDVE